MRRIRADVFFFSGRGISDGKITNSSKGERDIKIAMLENSTRRYFLCDSTKIGKPFPFVIADENDVDGIITD